MLSRSAWRDERGQGTAEYGMLISAVVVLVVVVSALFSEDVQTLFANIGTFVGGYL